MHLVDPRVSSFRADARRITAWSGAFALHVAVFGVLLAPIARPLLEEQPVPSDEPMWMALEPEPLILPTITPPRPEIVRVRPRPVRTAPIDLDRPVFVAAANPVPAIVAPAQPAMPSAAELAPVAAIATEAVRLRTRVAPPPHYPSIALRRKFEGTVVLRVLVGPDGRASEVSVERTSGHRVLDDAARRRVLDHWRFEPAMRNGVPVPAIGLLPIEFRINAG